MHEDNGDRPYLGAIVMGICVALLTFAGFWMLSTISQPKPSVQWVKLALPADRSYVSFLPCVRTSGWLLPVVECFPTESRSVGLYEDDPEAGEHDHVPPPDDEPGVARRG